MLIITKKLKTLKNKFIFQNKVLSLVIACKKFNSIPKNICKFNCAENDYFNIRERFRQSHNNNETTKKRRIIKE